MTDLALGLHGLGYAPLPLGADKRPLRKWASWRFAKPTAAEVGALFGPTAAAGVAAICGRPHDLVVLDFDDEVSFTWGLANLPAVRGVKSRRGGHLHFRHPVADRVVVMTHCGKGALELAPGVKVDVKALASYVVMPYSKHPSGFVYQGLGDWTRPVSELPVLPDSIARLALWKPKPAPPLPRPPAAGGDSEKALSRYFRKVGNVPPEGSGSDDFVFGLARWVKRNIPSMLEAEFVTVVRGQRPDFTEAWVVSKWRSATGERR
jgi:hypothetical protein